MAKSRLVIASVISLAACASDRSNRAPAALLELAGVVASGGALEIELDEHGCFGDLEAEVPISALPRPVVEAVARLHPGRAIEAAEREFQDGEWTYEVGLKVSGADLQLVVTPGGEILESERSIAPGEAPSVVLRAGEEAVPESELVSVDVVETRAGDVEYHVKRTREGSRFKVVVTTTGEVLERLREVPAEIELPMRD